MSAIKNYLHHKRDQRCMAGQRQNKNQFSVLYTGVGVNQDFIWLNAFHFEKKKKSYSKIVKCTGELRLLKGFLQG